MTAAEQGIRKILVATDFSPHAEAALRRAVWLAERAAGEVMLAHVLSDVRAAIASVPYETRWELVAGDIESFSRQLRHESDERLDQTLAPYQASGVRLRRETLLGVPFIQIIHAVQQEGYDLVLLGTRGHSGLKGWVLGSTAKRLVRKCPATVWVVKHEQERPLNSILVAVDFSEVSRRALEQAAWLARAVGANLHVLHVIDTADVPAALAALEPDAQATSRRREVKRGAAEHVDELLRNAAGGMTKVESHLAHGDPAKSIASLAKRLDVDLAVLGTVGRSGIAGLLLGNTAEKALAACPCDVLAVKPAGFVSPVQPPFWPLHPDDGSQGQPALPPSN